LCGAFSKSEDWAIGGNKESVLMAFILPTWLKTATESKERPTDHKSVQADSKERLTDSKCVEADSK